MPQSKTRPSEGVSASPSTVDALAAVARCSACAKGYSRSQDVLRQKRREPGLAASAKPASVDKHKERCRCAAVGKPKIQKVALMISVCDINEIGSFLYHDLSYHGGLDVQTDR